MNQGSRNTDRNPRMIAVIRAFHTLLVLVFVGAIVVVYYSGITDTVTVWLYLSTAIIAFEGIVITLTRGNCPLLYLHRRYGDEKRLFELVMPWRFAKYMFAFLFIVIIAGYVLILLDFD
jgi:hypothetical protein